MTLDAHVTGIWCGQIRGGVGNNSEYVGLNEGHTGKELQANHSPFAEMEGPGCPLMDFLR